MNTHLTTKQIETVMGRLKQPLRELFQQCKSLRKCEKLSDEKWVDIGLFRTLSNESTGRAFLQKLIDFGIDIVKRSLFFETLKSKRRLKFLNELGSLLYDKIRRTNLKDDPLKKYSCLDDYDIYAGDGHYHAAAVHDPIKDGKKYPVQHFYALDLRSQALKHLTQADIGGKRKREHDMRALKRLSIEELRQGAPKGRKVIYVWDKAGIDFLQWDKWKNSGGIYFISRERENMAFLKMADLPFDATSDINKGVLAYELVGACCGLAFRRIKYQCPITGKPFSFITSLTQIPPGLVAYLYRLRWDVEKVFDEVKNKLEEKKAWATSETAKNMQAEFICLTHNLILIIEDNLKSNEGIEDKKDIKRKLKRLNSDIDSADDRGVELPLHLRTIKRSTQRPVKFIRWLRNSIFNQASWRASLTALKLIYDDF